MNSNINRYSVWNILFCIIVLIIHYIGYINVFNIGLLCLLQFTLVCYTWYKIKNTFIDAYLIFSIALYAFNLGQPILEYLGLSVDYRNLLSGEYGVTEKGYYYGTLYSICALSFLHVGALYSQKKRYSNKVPKLSYSDFYTQIYTIKKIFYVFLLISAPFYCIFLYKSLGNVVSGGYAALYDDGNTKGSFWLLSNFYTPSLIALLFVSYYLKDKTKYIISAILIVTVVLPPMFLGGRTNTMIILSIVLLIYFYTHKLKIRHIVVITIASIFVLSIFHTISLTRFETGTNKTIAQAESENPVLSTISEMGWTLFCTAKTTEYYPETRDYEYGLSYIGDLLVVLPNMGIWEEHPSDKLSSAKWLQNKVALSSGIGYSMPAESFANFGWFGVFAMFVLGYLYVRMYDRTSFDMITKNPAMVVIGLIFLWFTISTVRNSLHTLVRALFYYMLPIYWILKNQLKNRNVWH